MRTPIEFLAVIAGLIIGCLLTGLVDIRTVVVGLMVLSPVLAIVGYFIVYDRSQSEKSE